MGIDKYTLKRVGGGGGGGGGGGKCGEVAKVLYVDWHQTTTSKKDSYS